MLCSFLPLAASQSPDAICRKQLLQCTNYSRRHDAVNLHCHAGAASFLLKPVIPMMPPLAVGNSCCNAATVYCTATNTVNLGCHAAAAAASSCCCSPYRNSCCKSTTVHCAKALSASVTMVMPSLWTGRLTQFLAGRQQLAATVPQRRPLPYWLLLRVAAASCQCHRRPLQPAYCCFSL